ncbi:MAG: PadR family transcriptional regulator [Frankiaceae bacterium]|nr:PadR family transcriptional regulator [Frankiaceae bacterium]
MINSTSAALLGFLRDGPQPGYQLHKIAADIAPFWTVTRSQVYRELATLADRGLVKREPTGKRDAAPFSITAKGRAAFRAWLATEPEAENLRIPLLLKLTFAEDLPAEQLQAMLQVHYDRHRALLAEYDGLAAELSELPVLQRVTLQYGIHYERAVIAWFEELPADIAPAHS